jgi:hypothetical protein
MAGGEGMMKTIDTYLAMRRATGFTLSTQEYLLRSFARFAADRNEAHIRSATAIDWASQAVSLAQRHARYQTVCRFAIYVHLKTIGTTAHRRTTSVIAGPAAFLTSTLPARSTV